VERADAEPSAPQTPDSGRLTEEQMSNSHISPSKFVVLIGTTWFILFTLFPPRCTITAGGETRRETSAFLYSTMFHHVERPMPSNGSSRHFTDKAGNQIQTTSQYDPVELDWTRYTLGSALILTLTCSVAFLVSSRPSTKSRMPAA